MLFDLMFHPNEACNLAGEPRHFDTLRAMREYLAEWMRETTSPA